MVFVANANAVVFSPACQTYATLGADIVQAKNEGWTKSAIMGQITDAPHFASLNTTSQNFTKEIVSDAFMLDATNKDDYANIVGHECMVNF